MTGRTPTLQTGIVHSKTQKIIKDEAMECIQELYVLMYMYMCSYHCLHL